MAQSAAVKAAVKAASDQCCRFPAAGGGSARGAQSLGALREIDASGRDVTKFEYSRRRGAKGKGLPTFWQGCFIHDSPSSASCRASSSSIGSSKNWTGSPSQRKQARAHGGGAGAAYLVDGDVLAHALTAARLDHELPRQRVGRRGLERPQHLRQQTRRSAGRRCEAQRRLREGRTMLLSSGSPGTTSQWSNTLKPKACPCVYTLPTQPVRFRQVRGHAEGGESRRTEGPSRSRRTRWPAGSS